MKLLIVDDSTIMRRAISKYLSSLNLHIVGTAANGQEALEIFKATLPDLVTMDITMPMMDGLACLEAILKIKPKTDVIIVSALTDQSTGLRALKLGAKAFLPKPFTEKQLIEEIQGVIGVKS